MAVSQNKLVPLLVGAAALVAVFISMRAFRSDKPVTANAQMKVVPHSESASAPAQAKLGLMDRPRTADGDKPNETLSTLVARLNDYDRTLTKVLADNERFKRDSEISQAELRRAHAPVAIAPQSTLEAPSASAAALATASNDELGRALQAMTGQVNAVIDGLDGKKRAQAAASGIPRGLGFDGTNPDAHVTQDGAEAGGTPQYSVVTPLGYSSSQKHGPNGAVLSKLVRTSLGDPSIARASNAVVESTERDEQRQIEAVPYFTIPENATLTRVTAMTALVGRVPIDGRVQDPMQFKAIIGRDNLAANGFDIPDEVSGMVVSGVAVGDMAMSCSEGHIHSLTFIFDDGAIRTVSTRKAAGASTRDKALGYISDEYGNPCVAGKFVTNAPTYLSDIAVFKGLGLAGRSYAAAQTTSTDSSMTGSSSTSVTGDRGAYVLGQAAAGAVDEVSAWLFSRLKNSFDAVVTPAGQKIVLHIDQEIAIDKAVHPRRLDHHVNAQQTAGGHHGLD